MATLAFFFALTGGAIAGAKYLTASDQITQGDLAESTYGNPVIASGKVTTGKIADGAITSAKFDGSALAPNADKLDGLDSSQFSRLVDAYEAHTGNVEIDDTLSTVVSRPLPVGIYVLIGHAVIHNGENARQAVECGLDGGNMSGGVTLGGAGESGSTQTLAMEDVVVLASDGTGSILCRAEDQASVTYVSLVAIKVDRLHRLPFS